MSGSTPARRRRLLRTAAWIQLGQGALMEGTVFVGFFVLAALRVPVDVVSSGFSFGLPYLQDNLGEMMLLSGVFAALRVIASIGLFRARVWAAVLTGVNGVVTLVLMVFLLPAGIADGVLAGATLVFLVIGVFGDRTIVDATPGGTRLSSPSAPGTARG